jgi:hypothetical protein
MTLNFKLARARASTRAGPGAAAARAADAARRPRRSPGRAGGTITLLRLPRAVPVFSRTDPELPYR